MSVPVPVLDLSMFDPMIEIVVRAGTVKGPNALKSLQANYKRADQDYPGVRGLSVVFHPGYDVDALALHNHFPHRKLSYATIARVQEALNLAGYGMLLYVTPHLPDYPDHHSLAVTVNGRMQRTFSNRVCHALINALAEVDNPHRQQLQQP